MYNHDQNYNIDNSRKNVNKSVDDGDEDDDDDDDGDDDDNDDDVKGIDTDNDYNDVDIRRMYVGEEGVMSSFNFIFRPAPH